MHALVATIGTAGDVLPMIGLARRLAARGHRVTMALNDHFGPDVARAGLDFVSLGTEAEWRAVYEDPRWYEHRRGIGFFFQNALHAAVGRMVEIVRSCLSDDLAVVASIQTFGAGVARTRFGVPLTYVYLQPSTLRWILPETILRATRADSELALHLRTGLRFIAGRFDGFPNPDAVDDGVLHLGLFPRLFSEPGTPWPDAICLSGFPLYDGVDADWALDPEQRAFLTGGDPVVLLNPGSNVHWTGEFCGAAVAACARVGARVVVLSRYGDAMPSLNGVDAKRFDFVPLGPALAHSAAMIHHAGISTVARCLVAGVPQLLCPLGYDHPFNARTLERLGVGRTVVRDQADVDTLAHALDGLLNERSYGRNAASLAQELAQHNEPERACDAIEALYRRQNTAA